MINKCKVEGCSDSIKSKGYCYKHYFRLRRHGSLDKPKYRREKLLENNKSYCSSCKQEKSLLEFNRDSQSRFGFSKRCKTCCNKKSKERYQKNKEKHKDAQLKNCFGISLDDFKRMLREQNGVCKLCGNVNKYKTLCVDHCHTTGKVRGLLCDNCNQGLGQFKDDKGLLLKAIKYLEE